MALFTKKTLQCTDFHPVHINSLNEDDHRQFAVTITAKVGIESYTSHLVFVHYKSGKDGCGACWNAYKRLQFRASVDELKDKGDETNLIVMGDMNADPKWQIYGEIAAEMHSAGLNMESWGQVWKNDPKNSWTRRKGKVDDETDGESDDESDTESDNESDRESDDESDTESNADVGNMLDQVACRTQPGVGCKVDLVSPPQYQLSSDHEKFYVVQLFACNDEPPTTTEYTFDSYFPHFCVNCGRGYLSKGAIHNPCPNVDEEDIAHIYLEAKKRKLAEKNKELEDWADNVFDFLLNDDIEHKWSTQENIIACLQIYRRALSKVGNSRKTKCKNYRQNPEEWELEVYRWNCNVWYANRTDEQKLKNLASSRLRYDKVHGTKETRKTRVAVAAELAKLNDQARTELSRSYRRKCDKTSPEYKQPFTDLERAAFTKYYRDLNADKDRKSRVAKRKDEIKAKLAALNEDERAELRKCYDRKIDKRSPLYNPSAVTALERAAKAELVQRKKDAKKIKD